MDSRSVLELSQDISSRLVCLETKVDTFMEWVEDLMDDYHVNYDLKYLDDFTSKSTKAKFEASWIKL